MNVAGHEELRSALRAAASAGALFCFLDYDGTLAPIAPRPELALPLPSTAQTLGRLASAAATYVAVVSGRRLSDVRSLLDVPGVFYIGAHGAELRLPSGEERHATLSQDAQEALQEVRRQLATLLPSLRGVWLEDKTLALACHYRQADPPSVSRLDSAVTAIAQRLASESAPLELIHGHCVWEFRPRGINKGQAVLRLLQTVRPDALPLYAGDDRTDEDAFALLAPPALTIRVGCSTEPTRARLRVKRPEDLKAFLDALAAARSAPGHR